MDDRLLLREWDPDRYAAADAAAEQAAYTGRTCTVRVTHVLRDPKGNGLRAGVAALSHRPGTGS